MFHGSNHSDGAPLHVSLTKRNCSLLHAIRVGFRAYEVSIVHFYNAFILFCLLYNAIIYLIRFEVLYPDCFLQASVPFHLVKIYAFISVCAIARATEA